MGVMDWLNAKYSVDSSQSKEEILDNLRERINKANNRGWFSFASIDYRNIKVDSSRILIKVNPGLFNPYRGYGVIFCHIENCVDKSAQIIAELKPLKTGLWIVLGILIPFSVISLWLIPGKGIYSFLIIIWVGLAASLYLAITFCRYRLKMYLKSVLEDIGIDNNLKKIVK
jgi:hypothetical protein